MTETDSTNVANSDAGNPSPKEDNVDDLKAKIADQSRKLAGSKSEALNIKAELDALKTKIEEGAPGSQETLGDIELFKQYCREAGVPFKEDLKTMRQEDKQDQYKEAQNEAVEKFLEQFPEYKAENDSDNSKWDKLIKEWSTYKTPSTPSVSNWLKQLTKAHKYSSPDNSLEKGKSLGKAEVNLAEQAKLGGSGGGATKKDTKRTPEQQAARDQFMKVRPEVFKKEEKKE